MAEMAEPVSSPSISTPRSVPTRSGWMRSPWLWLFLFALLFRLVYIAESARDPLYGVHLVDARVYDDWAREMARGHWLWNRVRYYLPVYPLFLALHKVALGDNPVYVKWSQAAMGALASVLLGLTAARLVGRRWLGLLAGGAMATNWVLVVYGAEEFAESFSVFFLTLALYCTIGRGRLDWVGVLLGGLAMALAAAVRPNLILFLPFAAGWIAWKHGLRRWRRAAWGVAIFASAWGFIFVPILLRNHRLTGAWMLRKQATWNFYSGVAPRFDGLPIPPGIEFDNYMRLPILEGLRSPDEIERFWAERGLQVLREKPLGVARVIARRVLMYLSSEEFSQEFDVHAYRSYSRFLSLPWPGFWLVGPLGLLGICIWRRWSKEAALPAILFVVGIVSIVPFRFADRYRLPSIPFLTLFAAAAVGRLVEWWTARRWRPLVFAAAGLAVLCFLSWPDWLGLEERRIARHDWYVGLHHKEAGRFKAALESFERSMRDYSWDADSPRYAAEILIEMKQLDRAEAMAREALRREPRFPEAMFALGRIALERGNDARAEAWVRRGLGLFPNSFTGFLLMARLANRAGEPEKEIAFFRQALREGAGERTVLTLGLRLEDLGRLDEALQCYERVLAEDLAPRFHRARAAMLAGNLFLRRRGDPAEARRYWSIIVERFPSETLFYDQACFLLNRIDETRFLARLEPTSPPAEKSLVYYVIGMHRKMDGDFEGARRAYRQCLGVAAGSETPLLPQKWAREDMGSTPTLEIR
ncbi:tetratricopeptide repeat protein [Candidatus Sumerlaeota bacterium]|nr:tetratricopeptide repeat protein [Candidatus Sumerlaeota bacterium]